MKGMVSDIQRFSLHDGPGIRTTVFLKGCNLRCRWCHNPESLSPERQLQFLPAKCIGCGACLEACPRGVHGLADGRRTLRRDRCAACGACTEICYAGALVLVGREMTAEEVLAEVLPDRSYYRNSGGGVTLSGGEPLAQADFCQEVLTRCRAEGIHTAVETNLAWPADRITGLLDALDLVMADLKLISPAAHERWTGAPNEQILANARRLAGEPVDLIVRTPVVPGVNDTPEEIGRIADVIRGFENLLYYELLPYHPLGAGKYESFGMDYTLSGVTRPSDEAMRALGDEARRRGIEVR